MEQTINNDEKKATLERRKIATKKIEDESLRQVTFTKRRKRLFRKASELCQLTGAKIAIIVTSQKVKLFTFEHPDVTTVINRYQKAEEPKLNHLKELNKKGVVKDENSNGNWNNIFWWQKDTSAMNLAEFRDSIEALRINVMKKANEMTITRNSQKFR
ncbi:hypothetical protein LIER_17044 [Lithospermum erythrorhizon]|uniref:MADS-box domain-containing protein n=1 Tax=Lithospermum erythrorhizon TaxID=34254 RepID=A0AAV3QBB3_LITER